MVDNEYSCLGKYKTQEMYDKAVDAFLLASKFVPDWFSINIMVEKLDNAVILMMTFLVDVDSSIITFDSHYVGFNTIDFNDINLDDDNFDGEDPETIIHVRFMAWSNRFKQHKACKKISKELMTAACHLTRWRDWCMSED